MKRFCFILLCMGILSAMAWADPPSVEEKLVSVEASVGHHGAPLPVEERLQSIEASVEELAEKVQTAHGLCIGMLIVLAFMVFCVGLLTCLRV